MSTVIATLGSVRVPWKRLRHRPPISPFLTRRLFALVWLGLGISLVSFTLTQLVPADPALANLGQQAGVDPAAVAAFDHKYGLDKPLPVQFAFYLNRLVHGDLGTSEQTQRPVLTDSARTSRPPPSSRCSPCSWPSW